MSSGSFCCHVGRVLLAPRPRLQYTGWTIIHRWTSLRNFATGQSSVATAQSTQAAQWTASSRRDEGADLTSHLDPAPDSYSASPFTDQCSLTVKAGAGGHGCISFLREKFVLDGPANGGDGGTGGSIFVQAVRGETSLHKLARRGILKAGRGKNGRGKGKGGERGEDMLIQVPVGTTIREISRHDPLEEELALRRRDKAYGRDAVFDDDDTDGDQTSKWRRDKWLLYPGGLPRSFTTADFPALPRPRRSNLTASQPKAPIRLDLDSPMDTPMLLAAGALGGLGNPHFVTKNITRPKYATRGDSGMSLEIQLELKLLADVGLVGLPNAGKSTLLRSLTKSRARVGSWAFTTLQPNVGTVVLDNMKARPRQQDGQYSAQLRESFTIADIPGLIEDAHLDRGLGLGFLRHVERAAVLAFVIDLSGPNAVGTLKGLWKEVSMFESYREQEVHAETERRLEAEMQPMARGGSLRALTASHADPVERRGDVLSMHDDKVELEPLRHHSVSSKPWLVVATKADLAETQANFEKLQAYLHAVQEQQEAHPSGRRNAWRRRMRLLPVSAIRAEGVDRIVPAVTELLDEVSPASPGNRPTK